MRFLTAKQEWQKRLKK